MTAKPTDTPGVVPRIPWLRTGPGFPLATLEAFPRDAAHLVDGATRGIPKALLHADDAISRRWLVRASAIHLDEIDEVAVQLGRPGAYFPSVNYEWGCTVPLREPAGRPPELVRVLDWRTPGLGRHVSAAEVDGPAGPFATLTWPGYTGVLQAGARGRFAAAINQAPLPKAGGGLLPLDWATNKITLWRRPALTPTHLLRPTFETAPEFAAALETLASTPIAAPTIYSLVGCRPGETAIVERGPSATRIRRGPGVAANVWSAVDWPATPAAPTMPAASPSSPPSRPAANTWPVLPGWPHPYSIRERASRPSSPCRWQPCRAGIWAMRPTTSRLDTTP